MNKLINVSLLEVYLCVLSRMCLMGEVCVCVCEGGGVVFLKMIGRLLTGKSKRIILLGTEREHFVRRRRVRDR
jgi:hypothetical protein